MNWGQIKAAVKQYLQNDETSFVANLTLFARLAEEDIYRQVQVPVSWPLSTTTVVVGDQYLTLPINTLAVKSLSVIDPITGEYFLLLPKDFSYLREAYPDPTTPGRPRFYAWRDAETLRIAPTPDVAYGAEMHHYRQPPSIGVNNDDSNSNWLSVNAENCLLFGILYHGYINEKGEPDLIANYKGQFDKAIADLGLIVVGRQSKDTYEKPDRRMPA